MFLMVPRTDFSAIVRAGNRVENLNIIVGKNRGVMKSNI